ncbi:tRNA (guanine37-N1)-methyltransferase [Carnobacterium iners]|uniref:tRNA (guanine-N(1)-)-methyltransferase n=1 Tax=Carnobacterium iners TaxID=1073423 RepID=A0A1X7NK77_9LACT|nr:tRNA (guanosine(37)-N1)-methyltransferase TrmD [Carnobacterium iners]SEK84587.1 tRNA (guanine37-N1)-methyltransferase [Carnobacterium iners]SMH37858.1 tRNA (guanine37-N1)-methyltransferase [Carnobacterium iners]
MKIDILTLFPRMFEGPLTESIIGKAIEKKLLNVKIRNFRDYSENKHRNVDDYPYGGGAGMLLTAQPIFSGLDAIETENPETIKRVILLDPAGVPFTQSLAEELSEESHLVFICGHYEGYDERIRTLVTDEISLGDFVLTGGELGAMVLIDAAVRLLPEVLGNDESAKTDSHSTGLLEHPQYTRPAEFRGMKVPDVLISGNHKKIAEWQEKESLRRTYLRRPDMLTETIFTKDQKKWLDDIKKETNLL